MTDSLFPDVSEFQCAVDDDMPYQILSIRSDDGTYLDQRFAANYAWMLGALRSGRLTCGIVYAYVRPNWQQTVAAMQQQINNNGGLDPRVILMLDVESGGNPGGDGSSWINSTYWALTDWLGTTHLDGPRRVIGYANSYDFYNLWQTRPDHLPMIGAGYGSNPNLPGQVAHQYTDGVYSHPYKMIAHKQAGRPPLPTAMASLPLGCPPFGHCDMNSADGLSPQQFAAACGVGSANPGGMTDQQYAEFAVNMAQLGPC